MTRLITCVANLDEETDVSAVGNAAKQLLTRLQEASAEFKEAHMSLLDTVDDDGAIASEQAVLDSLLDSVDGLATHLQNLIDSAAKPKEVDERKVISKRLGHLQKWLTTVDEAIKALEGRQMDAPHLRQHDEQLQDYKRELADVNLKLFSLDLEDKMTLSFNMPNWKGLGLISLFK